MRTYAFELKTALLSPTACLFKDLVGQTLDFKHPHAVVQVFCRFEKKEEREKDREERELEWKER